MPSAWIGLFAYSFQIYFDFSGYSEMAIGLGMMFGFTLPANFRAPYRATSLRDFWRRWHITLGSWVRDYLYIPLGGNRSGRWRTAGNIIVVMALFALWHGAAWQFLIWGGVHGLLLAAERLARPLGLRKRLPTVLRAGLTFLVVTLAWVLFRADSLGEAGRYYASLMGDPAPEGPAWWTRQLVVGPEGLVLLLLAALVTWGGHSPSRFVTESSPVRWLGLTILFWICLIAMGIQGGTSFLYYFF